MCGPFNHNKCYKRQWVAKSKSIKQLINGGHGHTTQLTDGTSTRCLNTIERTKILQQHARNNAARKIDASHSRPNQNPARCVYWQKSNETTQANYGDHPALSEQELSKRSKGGQQAQRGVTSKGDQQEQQGFTSEGGGYNVTGH